MGAVAIAPVSAATLSASTHSVSSTGNHNENAAAESIFASLETERIHLMVFATRTEAYAPRDQRETITLKLRSTPGSAVHV